MGLEGRFEANYNFSTRFRFLMGIPSFPLFFLGPLVFSSGSLLQVKISHTYTHLSRNANSCCVSARGNPRSVCGRTPCSFL